MGDEGARPDNKERRRYPRIKAQVPIQLHVAGNASPSRASTSEISLGGCYVESMFTLSVGTKVALTLWVNEQPIGISAVVMTRHPQVGNGFEFTEMSPEARVKLTEFILTSSQTDQAT
jgi:c-di-GMP-binding flagellar brake protein YcgR